jgi:hypothetical protein
MVSRPVTSAFALRGVTYRLGHRRSQADTRQRYAHQRVLEGWQPCLWTAAPAQCRAPALVEEVHGSWHDQHGTGRDHELELGGCKPTHGDVRSIELPRSWASSVVQRVRGHRQTGVADHRDGGG